MSHAHEVTNENEKKTLIVIIFTAITMIAEIIFGLFTHSTALWADGCHMGTHVIALSLTYTAYILIRKLKDSPRFPSGTDKIGSLTAYTSSLFLGLTGIWIIKEAVERLIRPLPVKFNEAIIVAVIGLAVNLICILIMERKHEHHHEHEESDEHKEDFNFKAAYYHILADILTSVTAISALAGGKYFGLVFLDPLTGALGGVLIINWAVKLIKRTVLELVDAVNQNNF